jgi:hypothetical protein
MMRIVRMMRDGLLPSRPMRLELLRGCTPRLMRKRVNHGETGQKQHEKMLRRPASSLLRIVRIVRIVRMRR